MSIEVKIPPVGESISSGVVSVWHKNSGDFVNAGDALFTLETDKVSTEIVAEKAGLLETKAGEGQEVKIGEVVAIIDDSKAPSEEKKTEKPLEKKEEPEAEKKPRQEKEKKEPPKKEKPLSPAVRRIVEEEHLEPAKISGTEKMTASRKVTLTAVQERKSVGEPVSFPSAAEDRQTQLETGRFTKKMSPHGAKVRSCDVATNHCHSHHFQRMRHERSGECAPIAGSVHKKNGPGSGSCHSSSKRQWKRLKPCPWSMAGSRRHFIQNNSTTSAWRSGRSAD
jgi:pyruvate/2-oxoglutarate dehydrogenase complex dihydrolipoamide acyltransferase (E2) component